MKNRIVKKVLRIIFLVLVGAAVVGTFYFLWKKAQPVITMYEVVTPKRDSVETKTVATGKVEPRDEVLIKPQMSGIISEVLKEAGQMVKEGEIIAKIKVIPEMVQLNSAESRVRVAKISLEQIEATYKRDKELHDQGVISKEDYETSLANYKKAQEEANKKAADEAAKKAAAAEASKKSSSTSGSNTAASSGSSTSSKNNTSGSSSSAATSKDNGSSSSGSSGSSGSSVSYNPTGQSVVNYACQFVGNPYVWGGTSLTNGADCSGFIMSVYAKFGVSLPHSSGAMAGCGRGVSYSEAMPGDIICYAGHVAIYMGGGQIVHASNAKDGIKISGNAAYRPIVAVRRVL